MIKKLLLLTIFFFWFFLNGNAFSNYDNVEKAYNESKATYDKSVKDYENAKHQYEAAKVEQVNYDKVYWKDSPEYRESLATLQNAKNEVDWMKQMMDYNKDIMNKANQKYIEAKSEQRKEDCAEWSNWTEKWSCIDQPSFEINTGKIFGGISATASATDTRTGTNMLLGTIIEKLMVALGILSVLIMTVWGGYIILYHGQDELLSKGKSIFMSWVVALVVALSSYMIVGLLRFILYNN